VYQVGINKGTNMKYIKTYAKCLRKHELEN